MRSNYGCLQIRAEGQASNKLKVHVSHVLHSFIQLVLARPFFLLLRGS